MKLSGELIREKNKQAKEEESYRGENCHRKGQAKEKQKGTLLLQNPREPGCMARNVTRAFRNNTKIKKVGQRERGIGIGSHSLQGEGDLPTGRKCANILGT